MEALPIPAGETVTGTHDRVHYRGLVAMRPRLGPVAIFLAKA
jgi:hypothetical protein